LGRVIASLQEGGVVELVAREFSDSFAAERALVVMTLLTFPITPLATLIYSAFVKSLVATSTVCALRRQAEAALSFREQVTAARQRTSAKFEPSSAPHRA
jgi:hypothetical protein